MTSTSVKPNREDTLALEFLAPFRASNNATFTLRMTETGTDVTWAMDGPNPVMSRVMGLFIDMDDDRRSVRQGLGHPQGDSGTRRRHTASPAVSRPLPRPSELHGACGRAVAAETPYDALFT